MTLPSNIVFPMNIESFPVLTQEEQINQWREMVTTLQDMYEDIVDVVNGTYDYKENPTISGSTSEGSGTYVNREAWQIRNGLICHYWFDIEWSAHSGTGNLLIDLPWEVEDSKFQPFVGVIESDNITLDAGYTWLTMNCIPNDFAAELKQSGSALPSAQIDLSTNTSGRIKGYVRYIGKEFDTN